MLITEKQLLFLITILKDTLPIGGNSFSYDRETRIGIYDTIFSQQSNMLVEVKDVQS